MMYEGWDSNTSTPRHYTRFDGRCLRMVERTVSRSGVEDSGEVLNSGDAYYMEPGHTAMTDAGTEWV